MTMQKVETRNSVNSCKELKNKVFYTVKMLSILIQAGRPKKRLLFGHLFFNNITNVFCAKKRVGHACTCPRMVTG